MRIDGKYCENARDLWRNRTGRITAKKIVRSIRDDFLFAALLLNSICFWERKPPEHEIYELASKREKYCNSRYLIRFWKNKKFLVKTAKEIFLQKLFQFAKIAHQSKTEFPQTISRK